MESTDHFLLPPAQENQTFVSVSAIPAGFITLPDWCFVAPSDLEARTVPSLSFLIKHQPSTTSSTGNEKLHRILFDLGLRSELSKYLPQQQSHLENGRKPYKLGPGVAKCLEDGGLSPKDIDFVFLSHVHYDHHGDPEDFPASTFIVGPGAVNVLEHGLPGTKGSHQCFEKDLLPKDRTYELPLKGYLSERQSVDWQWAPIGPFDNAIDLFGDSSVYVIDTPGHLPGHINLLCKVSPKKWLYLGGDICHDIRLLTGEKQIGTWKDEEGDTICIHFDKEVAEKSIGKARDMVKYQNQGGDGIEVEVILAHDEAWYEANKGRLFPDPL